MSDKQQTMINNSLTLQLLDSIPLFSQLDSNQKRVLQNSAVGTQYNKNDIVFHSGDKIDKVHFIVQGGVKIVKITDENKESINKIIRRGDFHGDLAAMDALNYAHFYYSGIVIKKNTLIVSIPLSVFKKIIEHNAEVYQAVVQKLLDNYKKTSTRLSSVMLKDSRSRVIDFLKEMANEIGKPVGYELLIKHNLTHQEMANIIGVSRQKVTATLNEFKQKGLIHLERNAILIHDVSLLE